ncbi:MAG: sorbosone dehydrogenase family protein [Acetobacteraceae bacterium]|nr:sorbosone dehydrogenase family protein [Acetobacteraceae bacterium]
MTGVARLAFAGAAVLALAGAGEDYFDVTTQIGPNPVLPEPQQYLLPPMHLSVATGWKPGEMPHVDADLRITALATDLQHPRSVYTLPNGDILVIESVGPNIEPVRRPKSIVMKWMESKSTSNGQTKDSNRITLLRSTHGDANPDVRTVFLDHLYSPFGVALVGSDLYVANTDAILHFPYKEGATSVTAKGEVLTPLPGGPIDHHWTKSLVASEDGRKLYVGVGSNSNITENGMGAELDRAAIWEVDRASGAHRLFATGLRNPNGLTWEPQSHVLWTVVNERDELGPNLVPDYLTSVKDGGFYGWPYCYFGQHLDPRVMPQRPDLVAKAIVPDYALSSHVAPLGLVFNTANGLPPRFAGGAFVGEHGSWNRAIFNGYKVVFVPFSNGKPNGMAEDVVTGFLDSGGHARGRPVALALDASGALLIADDVGNTVWRVSAAARPQTAKTQ